jgi:hypothetical protein
MRISIANVSNDITDAEFKTTVHAIERQVHEDFAPLWGMDAMIRMIAIDRTAKPDPEAALSDVVIYVGELDDDPQGIDGALGYHSGNLSGIPYGFVFADVARRAGEAWATTLSHEVLELLADPEVNLLVLAPHPARDNDVVLRPYEVCDPVQSDSYVIDGVRVSNFVTPLYFAQLDHPVVTQTNFLQLPLGRFGVRPGGYFSYLDLNTGRWVDIFGDDDRARKLAHHKQGLGLARRQNRRVNALKGLERPVKLQA